jgi:DNA-binding NarL/FixJ family response regulator
LPTPNTTTVLLAHFDDLLGGGLLELLDREPSLEVLASDVAVERLSVVMRAHRPDVALLALDAFADLGEVRALAARHPNTHLVLIAEQPSPAISAQLLAFGASACLGRDTQARDVLSAIHLASRGLQVIPSGQSQAAHTRSSASAQLLTRREAELLPLLQQGLSNARIALTLGVGIETVRTHARHIYRKLGVASRRELAAPAVPQAPPPQAPGVRHLTRQRRARRGESLRRH